MIRLLTVFFFSIFFSFYNITNAAEIHIDFYGESIGIEYDPVMVATYKGGLLNEQDIEKAYKILEERDFSIFLHSLRNARLNYHLNDWLYSKLMFEVLEKTCKGRSDRFRNMLVWITLAKSGFDARATFTRSELYVNVATREEVFESPMYDDRGKSFANLSVLLEKGRDVVVVYGVKHIPNTGGRDFSFKLEHKPRLQSRIQRFSYEFDFKGERKRLFADVNRTFIDIMEEYPNFDEIDYVTTPFSDALRNSLLPELKREIRGMGEKEKMEFLVTFTRLGLTYGSDKKTFGNKNRPLTAEEALYYPAVDCEDKVAVIYNLVKELTPNRAVVLALPDHLSFAVELSQPFGVTYRYKGKQYTICDPTGPESTCEIGIFPENRNIRRAEVLGELK